MAFDWSSLVSSAAAGISLRDATLGWSDMSARKHAAKWSSRKQLQMQKELASWEALTMPSLQVQGLKSAGLNPILAAGNNFGSSAGSMSVNMPSGDGGSSRPFEGIAKKEAQIANATLDNIDASTAKAKVEAKAISDNAATNRINAESNQWLVVDAKNIGAASFQVQILPFGKGLTVGGEKRSIHSLRINKVTGETYDALTGQRVKVLGESADNSAKAGAIPTTTNNFQVNHYWDPSKRYDDRAWRNPKGF